jgi:hypothetical protein
MPAIKYRVSLSEAEVDMLEALLRKGKSAARKQTRARILLKAAAGCKDAEINAIPLPVRTASARRGRDAEALGLAAFDGRIGKCAMHRFRAAGMIAVTVENLTPTLRGRSL